MDKFIQTITATLLNFAMATFHFLVHLQMQQNLQKLLYLNPANILVRMHSQTQS